MNVYQEITLIEQLDINYNHVFSSIYQELHNALSESANENKSRVAISFPEYYFNPKTDRSNLGKKMRVFGVTEADLVVLALKDKMSHFSDYIHISSIKDVGDKATHYEVYTRYRHDGYEKKARKLQAHFIKKFGEDAYASAFGSFDKVVEHCETYSKQLAVPFINMRSNSNGSKYCVRIKREKTNECSSSKVFDLFGLSCKQEKSAVPGW